MAKTAKPRKSPRAPAKGRARKGAKIPVGPYGVYAVGLIAIVAMVRLAINALGWVPVHFDEGQYWAYGQEMAAGHFSKPPLVGWIILIATEIGGDTGFALRVGAVIAHGLVALGIFLTGRALWDARTGFWASAGYTLAPGVSVSAMIMSTDPVMMACWAFALWAWIKAAETGRTHWWAAVGAAIGLGMLAKYTALAFLAGGLGYGLFSARGRDWRGLGIALVSGLIVFSPNLLWNLTHDFATVTHVAEDAAPGGSLFNVGKMAEFVGAQLGVIGPVWFAAMLAALWYRRQWADDWRMRMMVWQTFALLGAMVALSFVTRAQPNWAAPAYVAGSLVAARLLLDLGWMRALRAQLVIGVIACAALYGAAWAYAMYPLDLPRKADPFKKMRIGEPFCELALGAMAEEGAELLFSNDRRRLSECMFLGGLRWEDIAVWNPDLIPSNHHELVSTLRPGDDRVMLLAVMSPITAERISTVFDEAREIDTGTIRTHSDREFGYSLWVVQGFRGY